MITAQEVATELGVLADPRVTAATQAAIAWVEVRRCLTPAAVLWASAAVCRGAVLYACHLYQTRATPSGTDLYGDTSGETYALMSEIYRLVGQDPVIA